MAGGCDVMQAATAGLLYRTTGTPSPLSPTPSPAGSVGSVGSQSSGYSSGEIPAVNGQQRTSTQAGTNQAASAAVAAAAAAAAAASANGPCVSVPLAVHSVMQKQNQYFNYLCTCHELWEQADSLVQRARVQGKHIYIIIHYWRVD